MEGTSAAEAARTFATLPAAVKPLRHSKALPPTRSGETAAEPKGDNLLDAPFAQFG
jgi:hypothetical protein